MRIYSFAKNAWNEEEWLYAASKVTPYRARFIQEDAFIKNNRIDGSNGYEYISMVLKEKFTKNIRVEVEASFEKYGAPLIVLSNDLKSLDNGSIEYGTHYEIVAYEKGINAWHIFVDNGKQIVKNIFRAQFPVKEKERFILSLELNDKTLKAGIGGISFSISSDFLPEEFHVGITACEGINHFYNMKITG